MINGTIQDKLDPGNGLDKQAMCDWGAPLQLVIGDLEGGVKQIPKKADKFREKKNHRVIVHGRIRRNKLDGHVRIFGKIPNEPLANCGAHKLVEEGLGFVGRYENGIPIGVCWRGKCF